MISSKAIFICLKQHGISFFCGVPDSLLKDFCAYVADHVSKEKNIIAANEGNAIALAAGHNLATGGIGLVYMQNSGLGNALNPLLSLTDPGVYSIPMLLLIGWRGESGSKDEPQHITQGKVTTKLLDTLGVEYDILPNTLAGAKQTISKAIADVKKFSLPYALVVRKGTFIPYQSKQPTTGPESARLVREDAIKIITNELPANGIFISTTGKTSRELFEIRENSGQNHERDFLNVGAMGHSSQIALGVALSKPNKQVFCLDGDGALIMHMGSLAVAGNLAPKNFRHIVFNNFAHESVGGQPTAAPSINIPAIARACGYKKTLRVYEAGELKRALSLFKKKAGPVLLEVLVRPASRVDLGRPSLDLIENKKLFTDFVNSGFSVVTARDKLKKFLTENKIRRILLVIGKKSYAVSGAERMFRSILASYQVFKFNEISPNPKFEDVERGVEILRKKKCDTVIAIGGGSVLDVAKLINIFSAQSGAPLSYILGQKAIIKPGKPLVALPTTAGSGSEATHFAVIYINGVKHSIAHQFMLPSLSIVEPELVMSMPKRLAAASGMDALAQAIESYWSINATEASKRFSESAIRLALDNFVVSVRKPTLKSRAAMARAAYLSGKAINITKTTAPHAISYFFTSRFGVPHGHAVGLTLGSILDFNCQVSREDVGDKRGLKYVRDTMAELLRLLEAPTPLAATRKFEKVMKQVSLETKLSDLGVKASDIDVAVKSVNRERLQNNPRRLDRQALKKILTTIL